MALNSSPCQRSQFVIVMGVDFSARLAGQEANHLHVPPLRSHVQRSSTSVFFHNLEIGTATTMSNKNAHHFKVAFLRCQVQRCSVRLVDRRFHRGIHVSRWEWWIIALMLKPNTLEWEVEVETVLVINSVRGRSRLVQNPKPTVRSVTNGESSIVAMSILGPLSNAVLC